MSRTWRHARYAALATMLCILQLPARGEAIASCQDLCGAFADCDTPCNYVPGPEYETIQTTCGNYNGGMASYMCDNGGYCGDGRCDQPRGESVYTCADDCGAPPIPPDTTCHDCVPGIVACPSGDHYCDSYSCCVPTTEPSGGGGAGFCNNLSDCNPLEFCINGTCVLPHMKLEP
jgi:hypothetical protein